jgi:PIN domain nuclease of toxin-antitoxin system
MELLIDTQSFIWFMEDDVKMPMKIKVIMNDEDNVLLLSIVSLWEITIKTSIGKLKMQRSIDDVIKNISADGFKILPIKPNHLLTLSKLEFIHRDPFDRMIISQGIAENISVISADSVFREYPVQVIYS